MTDKEILSLAHAELKAMYKRSGINGSNVLTLIDEALRQPMVSGSLCQCKVNRIIVRHEDKDWCNSCGELVKAN